ncbi:MAG: hypothetical protein NT107_08090, partial [Planctomycetota bacterium]|nr:hypothetical protein [Planctomycetota bacterium]
MRLRTISVAHLGRYLSAAALPPGRPVVPRYESDAGVALGSWLFFSCRRFAGDGFKSSHALRSRTFVRIVGTAKLQKSTVSQVAHCGHDQAMTSVFGILNVTRDSFSDGGM